MSSIVFGDLLQLMLTELADTIEQSEAQAAAARVRLDDIELDIPAHLQLLNSDEPLDTAAHARALPVRRLVIGMPSPRETLPAGRVGRIRVTFEAMKSRETPDP